MLRVLSALLIASFVAFPKLFDVEYKFLQILLQEDRSFTAAEIFFV